MASTSTGYNKTGIWKEQYSTDGQVQRWSSGSKAYFSVDSEIEMESGSTFNVESGAVFNISGKQQIKSGGELEFESGSTLNVESGASINIATSGYLRVPVSSGTTNTTDQKLPAFGVSILTAATSNTGTSNKGGPKWTLRQPKGAGYRKTFLLADTTKTVLVRMSTDKTVVGYATGKKYHSLQLIGKAAASTILNTAEIVSKSSVCWALVNKSSGMLSAVWTSWYRP